MLTTYREAAATSLTLKTATQLLSAAESVSKLDPSAVSEGCWEDIMQHAKLVDQLANLETIARQLGAASDVEGAQDAHKSLLDRRQSLLKWADTTLCPAFDENVATLKTWAESTITVNTNTASCTEAAQAFPKDMPKLPETIDCCFWLRCFLTSTR